MPKKLSTLSAELRLRQVPGKSVERSRWRRRLDVFIDIERQQSSRPRIVGVSLPPLGLLGALALGLALSLRACALARADPSIRSKPLSAETTRSRPVRHPSAGARTDPTTTLPTLDAQVAAATFTSAALRATLDGSFLQSDLGPFLLSAQVRACNVRRGNEKGRVERPIGFVRSRFWPGRRFSDLMDLNVQALAWRDDYANNRVHEVTGKVPALVFQHEEKAALRPLPTTPFNTDDVEGQTVTKLFRVRFDKNTYSVPPGLVSQSVVVRADDEWVRVMLGTKEVAAHRRSWLAGVDLELPAHRAAALEYKPGATRDGLPPILLRMGDVAARYFKVAAAGTKSLTRETVRLVFFAEVYGAPETAEAMTEVMSSGHVGADYVEYVLRQKKGLVPRAPPLKLGKPDLDDASLPEPDLSRYDNLDAKRDATDRTDEGDES